MKLKHLAEMCRWFGRAALLAYMALSVLAILYTSSQTSEVLLSVILSSSLRSLGHGTVGPDLSLVIIKQEFPVPENNVYYDRLAEGTAQRSALHQRKFLARKDHIVSKFDPMVRFQSNLDNYAAILISDSHAFLHIWKCGGTSIASLAGDTQWALNATEVQRREWVAFVRDPIDRMLSAWAECGFRQLEHGLDYEAMEQHTVLNWLDRDYDFRVRAFLNEVRDFTFPNPELSCHTHAHPMANYMINAEGVIDEHVTMVGDLSELRPVLEIAGFHKFIDHAKGRDASSNQIKSEKFPARRDLLKDATILELCEFYALDYHLFDFDPPAICVLPGGPLAKYL